MTKEIIDAEFKEEVKETKINVIACYKYFWTTEEFEQWQKDTKDTVINIAQITPTQAQHPNNDNMHNAILVVYTMEAK